jgi:hypothetical protein
MPVPTVSVTINVELMTGAAVPDGTRVSATMSANDRYSGGFVLATTTTATTTDGVAVMELFPNALDSDDPPGLGLAGTTTRFQCRAGSRKLDVTAVIPNVDCNLHEIVVDPDEGRSSVPLIAMATLATYAALRAYEGSAKAAYVSGYLVTAAPARIAGTFTVDDSDTTSADNGGTIIVDGTGRRWKRVFDGAVNVMWFDTAADGATDDLEKLEDAQTAAIFHDAVLYLPLAAYGVADRFMFADGVNVFFEPGASIKLLGSTSSGAAVSGPYPTQTLPMEIHNLTIDCNNIAGENGIGIGHWVGVKLFNLTVRNCLHDSAAHGGKALQFEGAQATNVQVLGLNLLNCSVGVDIGAVAGVQSVHIGIFVASMKDVDIPVHVNDTNTTTPSDSFDQMEALIDGLHCRNCGKLTYSGATATGGGIIVSDRGYKLTVRNVQVINDRGGYGSTAYGTIGSLVRGQAKGIVVERVLIDADMVAIFDHNPAVFQSPFAGNLASYVLADDIRHYGNLDYVVKCLPGGGKMGAGVMRRIEIGSSTATLTGLVDANAAAYSTPYLEVIDRDANWQSTGLRSLAEISALGNTLATNLGHDASSQKDTTWVPVDGSTGGLTFSNVSSGLIKEGKYFVLWAQFTYPPAPPPSAVDALPAKIGGIPFTIRNVTWVRAGGVLTLSTTASVQRIYPESNGTAAPLLSATSVGVTNADCYGHTFGICLHLVTA